MSSEEVTDFDAQAKRLDLPGLARVYLTHETLPRATKQVYSAPEPTLSFYRYRVSQPYLANGSAKHVNDAVSNVELSSSAVHYKAQVHDQLLKLFGPSITHAQTVANGYNALVVALKVIGITSGDEILIPALTFSAVLNAVLAVGATPRIVDSDVQNYNPSMHQWRAAFTNKTRAIIVAYPFGLSCDPRLLAQLCKEMCCYFIEDISEALGCRYHGQLLGSFGDFGCCSLFANKIITGGDGGT